MARIFPAYEPVRRLEDGGGSLIMSKFVLVGGLLYNCEVLVAYHVHVSKNCTKII